MQHLPLQLWRRPSRFRKRQMFDQKLDPIHRFGAAPCALPGRAGEAAGRPRLGQEQPPSRTEPYAGGSALRVGAGWQAGCFGRSWCVPANQGTGQAPSAQPLLPCPRGAGANSTAHHRCSCRRGIRTTLQIWALSSMPGNQGFSFGILRVRRTGPDSFQWCPATGQGAPGTN